MAIVLSLFAGRLVQLQGFDSKVLQARAAEQRVRPETLPAKRGSITDANGHDLAVTVEARRSTSTQRTSTRPSATWSPPRWPGS